MKQFLTLPFSKQELLEQKETSFSDELFSITEGYVYNPGGLHGYKLHAGVDFGLPYGSNIYSPCDGYITSSYNFQRATNEDGSIKQKDGANISYGLGYCVQIFNEDTQLFILFGHLSYIARNIPFQKPLLCKDDFGFSMYSADGLRLNYEEKQSINGLHSWRKIIRGQFIGQVGLSGLQVSSDFPENIEKPRDMIVYSDIMYTLPHIHFQVFSRDDQGRRQTPLDPYDLYDFSNMYPTNIAKGNSMGEQHMFIINKEGLPLFADEMYLRE